MDIARPDVAKKKQRRRNIAMAAIVLAVPAISIGLSRLKPALPLVDSTFYTDTVKRGPMVCEVHGTGTLVPEEIRWVTATTGGRVENIPLLPGVTVEADTVLVELSNPQLVQETFEAQSLWHVAEAQLEKIKVQLESDKLAQRSVVASLKADLAQAKIEADADEELMRDRLVPLLTAKRSRSRANELQERYELEQERLRISDKSTGAQVRVQEAEVERLHKQTELKQHQLDALKVRAGIAGVLQRMGDDRPPQIGQQITAGTMIALIANPTRLKAQIKVAETDARDIQFDQPALIDTRNGTVPGHITRIDPAVVNATVTIDIALDDSPPRGARPDLNVDATITLERLENVLFTGRPANSRGESRMHLFKVVDDGTRALRVDVQLGRASISSVEIKQALREGDTIILSDMSHYDAHQEVRLK